MFDWSESEVFAMIYSADLGRTMTAIWILEATLVHAIQSATWNKRPEEETFHKRFEELSNKTMGNLIKELERVGVENRAARYLRSVKALRDWFIHRSYYDIPQPYDIRSKKDLISASDVLLRCQRHFMFAHQHTFRLLVRAGVMRSVEFIDGTLMIPKGLDDLLE